MGCRAQFADLSKEEKEELAKQRMEDMRLKNEEIRRRHAVSTLRPILDAPLGMRNNSPGPVS